MVRCWQPAHDVYEIVFPQYNPETQQLVQTAPVISGRTVTLHTVADRPPPPTPQPPPTSEPEPEPELTTNTSGADTAI